MNGELYQRLQSTQIIEGGVSSRSLWIALGTRYTALSLISVYGEVNDKLLDVMEVTQRVTVEKYLLQLHDYLNEYQLMDADVQQISISTINEFLVEYYESLKLPVFDEKTIGGTGKFTKTCR